MHKTTIIGHIGGEITLRNTNTSQRPVCNFSVCVNDKWTDKATGEKRERAQWYRCVAWNGLALTVKEHMASGRQVYVEGRIQDDGYEVIYKDANGQTYAGADGQLLKEKRTGWKLICSKVDFLGKNPNSNAYGAPAVGTVVQPIAAVAAVAAPLAAPVAAPIVAAAPETVATTFVGAPVVAPAVVPAAAPLVAAPAAAPAAEVVQHVVVATPAGV